MNYFISLMLITFSALTFGNVELQKLGLEALNSSNGIEINTDEKTVQAGVKLRWLSSTRKQLISRFQESGIEVAKPICVVETENSGVQRAGSEIHKTYCSQVIEIKTGDAHLRFTTFGMVNATSGFIDKEASKAKAYLEFEEDSSIEQFSLEIISTIDDVQKVIPGKSFPLSNSIIKALAVREGSPTFELEIESKGSIKFEMSKGIINFKNIKYIPAIRFRK